MIGVNKIYPKQKHNKAGGDVISHADYIENPTKKATKYGP